MNKEQKKFFFRGANFSENYYVTPSFFIELNSLELTKTDNYKDVEKSVLYKALFNKLKGIIKDKERQFRKKIGPFHFPGLTWKKC